MVKEILINQGESYFSRRSSQITLFESHNLFGTLKLVVEHHKIVKGHSSDDPAVKRWREFHWDYISPEVPEPKHRKRG
ncbi:hypothetical protein HY404_04220 [Candidatus Microgenomates bacterium]|nr:hypothetical protein [Candidatus Microgenomates bacterium]